MPLNADATSEVHNAAQATSNLAIAMRQVCEYFFRR
jgi:hypothetical protein